MGEAENRQGILLMSQHRNGEAIKHFRRASQLNYPPGAFNLAQCYELGIGTKQDFKEVFTSLDQRSTSVAVIISRLFNLVIELFVATLFPRIWKRFERIDIDVYCTKKAR